MAIVERNTSKGPLVVTIDPISGKLGATLDGRALDPTIVALPATAATPIGTVTHTVGGGATRCALLAAEHAAIEDARAAWSKSLPGQRAALTRALAACERGAYPGSCAAKRESAALKSIADFDAAHQEVIAEIQREHAARIGEVD